jgi:hypothetical protein
MALILNIINIAIAILAVAAAIYLMRNAFITRGPLRTALLITNLGIVLIIAEHFVIAYLRRSEVPLESGLWFVPLPLYGIAIIFILIGGYYLNKVFKMASEKMLSDRPWPM